MNKESLLALLNEKLVGKECPKGCIYSKESLFNKVIREQLLAEGVKKEIVDLVDCDHDKQSNGLTMKYRNRYVCYVEYTKTKGDYERYFGYRWLFKEFRGSKYNQSYDFDFLAKVQEIDNEIIEAVKAQTDTEQKMFEAYKKVVALFGEDTYRMITYFYKHSYTLESKLKEEEAK